MTSKAAKPIGSGEAMEISRRTSPFYSRWVEEQEMDLATARDAIVVRDFGKLASIAEHNCLKMHSVAPRLSTGMLRRWPASSAYANCRLMASARFSPSTPVRK